MTALSVEDVPGAQPPLVATVQATTAAVVKSQPAAASAERLASGMEAAVATTAAAEEDYKPQCVLVTGGAGFIASHVVRRIVREHPDVNVVVLDRLDYCASIRNLAECAGQPNFHFAKGDICSADLVSYLLNFFKIDTIMHFAASTHVDNSFGNSLEFTHNNVYGTHVLLEAARVAGRIRRFLHVSTDEVYGEAPPFAVVGNGEESRLTPTNPYAASKAGAEMICTTYRIAYGLPIITTRGCNVYGPGQFPEKLVPKFLMLALDGRPLPVHGAGSNVRNYAYVEDVAEAFDLILHKGKTGEVYNVSTQHQKKVVDVAKDICRLFELDEDTTVKFVPDRTYNDSRYFLDSTKVSALGWRENTPWEEGLKKTAEWYRANRSHWGDVQAALVPHPKRAIVLQTDQPEEVPS
eukprot:jgi/Chlat1/4048/Chrsp26S08848